MAATKLTLCALTLALSPIVLAEREMSIRDYSQEIRSRVAAKVAEAIGGDGKGNPVEISGVVTFVSRQHFFLQRDHDGLKILTDGKGFGLCPGDTVTVLGVPFIEGGRVVLKAKSAVRMGKESLPAARMATAADLVDGDSSGAGVNWLRVVVEGRVLGSVENGFAVDVSGVPVNVVCADPPAFLADAAQTHPVVRTTGVAELLLDPSSFIGQEGYVMGVKVDAYGRDVELVPDGEYRFAKRLRLVVRVAVAACAFLVVLLTVIGVLSLRQRRRLLMSRTIAAERKRMADDLHDTIEQHLVGAGILIKLNRLSDAEDVIVRAKREIRDIVWGLKNDDMMRQSPAEMLRALAHVENTKGICRVNTRLRGLPAQMDAAAMRDLSLIVREAIGNAVKHGGARKVAVSTDPEDGGGWCLRIANDGRPFDPQAVPGAADGHFGIEGMRQRARRLGATLTFSEQGGWTVVSLTAEKGVRT